MTHIVSGLIRKAPFVKQLAESTMFVVELSEMVKDYKTGEKTYSNYKAMMFAKTPAAIDYYTKATAEGSFVVINCEKLKVEQREHNGKIYITLMMENSRLEGAHFDSNQAPQQQQQQQQQRAPQQQQPQGGYQNQPPAPRQQHQQQPAQAPHLDGGWDDDIPFAPLCLQYPALMYTL